MTAAMSVGEDVKDCAFCGEVVKAVAKKCKHCGETLDVALRAAEEAKRTAEARNPQQPMVFMNAGGGAAVAAAPVGKLQGSWLILIFWIFVFFPAAIIYFLMRRWV